MQLSREQIESYRRDGYLFLPAMLSAEEIAGFHAALPALFSQDTPRRILETDGVTVRSHYGAHADDSRYGALVRDARMLQPARQLIGDAVYAYQFKINSKLAFSGECWAWHQDFIYWQREDGVPMPHMTTVAVFLDEVKEFNGPLVLVPGSHSAGVIDVESRAAKPAAYADSPDWVASLTADIKYSVPQATVAMLAAANGLVAPKGPRGSLLFFHPNLVHASAANISPFDRIVALATYNSVQNLPLHGDRRPDFLCSRDFAPLESLPACPTDHHRHLAEA
jgi:ectoine hydroxylase